VSVSGGPFKPELYCASVADMFANERKYAAHLSSWSVLLFMSNPEQLSSSTWKPVMRAAAS